MAVTSKNLSKTEHSLLDDACARNVSVEIQLEQDGALRVFRARLLDLDARRVWIDRPVSVDQGGAIPKHEPLTVTFMLAGTYYAFDTEVVSRAESFQLNARNTVPAATLRLPCELSTQQRRRSFRLSLARYDVTIEMQRTDVEGAHDDASDAGRMRGRIVDISTGGVGVLISKRVAADLSAGDVLALSFTLPDAECALQLSAKLQHVRGVRQGSKAICGLRFLPTDDPCCEQALQDLEQFIVAEQQRQLRKGR